MSQRELAKQHLDNFTGYLLRKAVQSRAYQEAGKARSTNSGRPSARAIRITEDTVREEEAIARYAQSVSDLFSVTEAPTAPVTSTNASTQTYGPSTTRRGTIYSAN
jgi:hypothetical protein